MLKYIQLNCRSIWFSKLWSSTCQWQWKQTGFRCRSWAWSRSLSLVCCRGLDFVWITAEHGFDVYVVFFVYYLRNGAHDTTNQLWSSLLFSHLLVPCGMDHLFIARYVSFIPSITQQNFRIRVHMLYVVSHVFHRSLSCAFYFSFVSMSYLAPNWIHTFCFTVFPKKRSLKLNARSAKIIALFSVPSKNNFAHLQEL